MEVILNNQRLETDVFLGSHNNSFPPTQELFPELLSSFPNKIRLIKLMFFVIDIAMSTHVLNSRSTTSSHVKSFPKTDIFQSIRPTHSSQADITLASDEKKLTKAHKDLSLEN